MSASSECPKASLNTSACFAHTKTAYGKVKSTMKNHVRLIDGDGNLVKNKKGGAALSFAEARRYLEGLPEQG